MLASIPDQRTGELNLSEDRQGPGIPIYIDDSQPQIDDPSIRSDKIFWFPANRISTKLATCLEAVRDISRLLGILADQDDPASDKRIVKLLATPLYNFAVGVENVFKDLQGNAKEYGQLDDSQRGLINDYLSEYSKKVPLRDGALRTVRNKIGSHVDHDVFIGDPRKVWGLVDLDQQLSWLKTTVQQMEFLLSLDVYAWTRDSGHPDIFRLMSVDGIQVDLDVENKVILGVTMARSPKYYLFEQLQKVASLCGKIKSTNG